MEKEDIEIQISNAINEYESITGKTVTHINIGRMDVVVCGVTVARLASAEIAEY